jgi:hypothetical protein
MLPPPQPGAPEGIVSGLTGVRAYATAYPRCSLNTARINASQLRAKPHIQQEIARRRAQAEAIVGPDVLILIEKRRWLARVVRANLAFLDPEIDGDLLVSLHVEEGRKQPRVSKMRIANKLAAIRLDSRLAGDEPAKSKPSKSSTSYADELLAAGGIVTAGGLVVPLEWARERVPPTAPPEPSQDTPASEVLSEPPTAVESRAPANHHESANSESPAASPDIPPEASDSTFDPRPSSFVLSAPSPVTSHESPISSGYIAPVFHSRPRFDPGPDYAARQRAKRRQPVVRHLWDQP